MSTKTSKFFVSAMIVLFVSSIAVAADRDRDGDRTKDQKKDGSCQTNLIYDAQNDLNIAARGQRNGGGQGQGDRDRRRDGSCLLNVSNGQADMNLSARNQRKSGGQGQGDRDRRRDGSCLTS